jgi:hypothetical protein
LPAGSRQAAGLGGVEHLLIQVNGAKTRVGLKAGFPETTASGAL